MDGQRSRVVWSDDRGLQVCTLVVFFRHGQALTTGTGRSVLGRPGTTAESGSKRFRHTAFLHLVASDDAAASRYDHLSIH